MVAGQIRLDKSGGEHTLGIVRVPQEEDGLRVHLVGKEQLGEESLVLPGDVDFVHLRIPFDVLVLNDSPEEGPDTEVVDGPDLGEVGYESPVSAPLQSSVGMLEVQIQVPPQF